MERTHVIIGAGAIGSATALELARTGDKVIVVSRRGSGPVAGGIDLVAADATDGERIAAIARGAAAIYNCANPRYTRWAEDWPPIAAALLVAAEQSGARLVTMSNLYMYEPNGRVMVEGSAVTSSFDKGVIRECMWEDALAAMTAGRLEATEARASDYVGPGVTDQGHLGERVVPRILNGKSVSVVGDPDAPHSWTYVPDVARTLAALGTSPDAAGKVWHVPSNKAASAREMVSALSAAAGVPAPKVRGIPSFVLRGAGLVSGELREITKVLYQFERPFVMSSDAATKAFGIRPTHLDEIARATVAWWRDRLEGEAGVSTSNRHAAKAA